MMDEQKVMNPYDKDNAPSVGRLPAFLKGCAILLAVLLVLALLIWLCVPGLFYRFYFGDRIKGIVTVTVDGQPAQIVEDSICIHNVRPADESQFDVAGNTIRISTKGNEYGSYDYAFMVDEFPDIPLRFSSYQFNWWNVTEFELHYNINTEKNLVEYEAECVYLLESGRKSELQVQQGTYALDDIFAQVYVCSP